MKTHRRSAAVLVAMLTLAMVLTATRAIAAEPAALPQFTIGQSLESALAALNSNGHRITFSTALVHSGMRLTALPDAENLEQVLRQLLAPWELLAEPMPGGGYRVVRAPPTVRTRTEGTVLLDEVNVTASRFGLMDVDQATPLYLDRMQIAALPHIADDALRALRVLPGVSGGDFSARLHLRGGRRDEVALRLDGAEIHDPFHLRELDGPIGILDTNLVQHVDVTTGGLTADFGDRMSGLVDIAIRTPQASDEYRHAVGASFVTTFARTSGRYAADRGYYLLSARRGYLDLVLKRVQDDDEELAPRYSDIVVKAGYALGERTTLMANALIGRDDMTMITEDDEETSAGQAETAHLWLTLDHEFTSGVRVRSIAAVGDDRQDRDATNYDPTKLVADLDMTRKLRFATLRQDWTWQPTDLHLFRIGVSSTRYKADFDYTLQSLITDPLITGGGAPIDNSHRSDLGVRTTELGAYAAWRTRLGDGLFSELGLRYDRYGGDLTASRTSPRFNVVYDPGGSRQYRLALSRIHQPQRADELQVEDGVTQLLVPERADQLSFGITQRFGDTTVLQVDAYIKRYEDPRPRFENLLASTQLISEAEPDRVRIEPTAARAQGIELSLRARPTQRTNVFASYVYSKTEDEEEDGWHPRPWDQPHALTAGLSWAGDKWRVSATGNWHTGWPTTPVSIVESEGSAVARPGRRNSARFDSFSRIDLRASRSRRFDSGTLTWYVEVYNLFNTKNRCCIHAFHVERSPAGALVFVPEYDNWLPILPSFGIQYEF